MVEHECDRKLTDGPRNCPACAVPELRGLTQTPKTEYCTYDSIIYLSMQSAFHPTYTNYANIEIE